MSKSDLDAIQKQLRVAIQNHQVLVARMKSNPQDSAVQRQLHDIQRDITSLSERQKVVVQLLRKEIISQRSNGAAPHDSASSPIKLARPKAARCNTIPGQRSVPPVPAHQIPIKPKLVSQPQQDRTNNNNKSSSPIGYVNSNSSSARSSPSSNHKLGSYVTSQPLRTNHHSGQENVFMQQVTAVVDPHKQKSEFMATLELVSPEKLKELHSKRSERKRRTTANPNFSYGNYLSERKYGINNYLSAVGARRQHRQYARDSPVYIQPCSPSPSNDSHERNGSQENGLECHDIHDDYCAVCRRSGQLLMCDTCSLVYHLQCLNPPLVTIPTGVWRCPKCQIANDESTKSQDNKEMVQTNVDAVSTLRLAKEEERRKLLDQQQVLQSEQLKLQQKTQQLTNSINAQTHTKTDLLQSIDSAQQSIDDIQKFIHVFKT